MRPLSAIQPLLCNVRFTRAPARRPSRPQLETWSAFECSVMEQAIWWVGSSSQVLRTLAIPASRFPLGAPSSTSPAGSISAPLSMSGITVVPPLSPPSSPSASGSSGFAAVTAAASVALQARRHQPRLRP
ncbi:hypothetical protein C8R45DRAFT_1219098 [Mycena sanguinolenta]|nr:hypothetical protein C8R45DRAFT_1219098 [Mycena sanguinolenta]